MSHFTIASGTYILNVKTEENSNTNETLLLILNTVKVWIGGNIIFHLLPHHFLQLQHKNLVNRREAVLPSPASVYIILICLLEYELLLSHKCAWFPCRNTTIGMNGGSSKVQQQGKHYKNRWCSTLIHFMTVLYTWGRSMSHISRVLNTKNREKIRESLFTFSIQNRTSLISRDFLQKI